MTRLSEQEVEYLWSAEPYEPDWRGMVRERLRRIAEECGVPLGQWLLGACAIRDITVEHVRELEAQLGTDQALRNMLRSITQRVRNHLPRFPLARLAIAVERPANPFNPDMYTAERLRLSRQLLRALQMGYRRDLESLHPPQRVGLLLMSAAYSGGLLDIAQLDALVSVPLERIEWLAGVPEVRLPLSLRGKREAEHRQWFPDPATLMLMFRCADDLRLLKEQLQRRGGTLRCVNAFLTSSGMPVKDLPGSPRELLELLRMQVQLHLPQMIVNFACRQMFVSHSLRPSSWGEIFGVAGLDDPANAYGRSASEEAEIEEGADAPDWLLEICQKIRSEKCIEAPQDASELQLLVTEWAGCMLSGGSVYGNSIGRSTVARYVRLLGQAFEQLDGLTVFRLEPDALENIYEGLLEAQPSDGKRRTLARAIYEFHTFLERHHHYPPISPFAVLGIGQDVSSVDARILSEDQYQAVLRAIATCGLELRTPHLVTAAKLLLILGFRLGLRRNEALKLRLCDIHFPLLAADCSERIHQRQPNMRKLSLTELVHMDLPIDLLVRPHALRGLKTQNSVRRLPLVTLLEPDELTLLMSWCQQRQAEEGKKPFSEFLLCIPELRSQWISESTLMPALHACMRAVTGADVIHYHHLRHSCATWLMLKLSGLVTNVTPKLIFDDLPQTSRWLQDLERLRAGLAPPGGGPTRRVAHIVSALLGHSSPKVSLLHYVHCLPQMLALAWQWNPKAWLFSAYNVASIAQVSLPTMEASSEAEHLLKVIGRVRSLRAHRRTRKAVMRPVAQFVEQNWAIKRICQIESMLAYASYAEEANQQVNLDWLEFSPEDRALMLERARYIRDLAQNSLSSNANKHRLRSSLHTNAPSLVPMPPRHGGRNSVAVYAHCLYTILEGAEGDRANRVLDDFVERSWFSESTLRFYRKRDEDQARDYLWLLTALGIPARSIELIVYDRRKPRASKAYWRRVLGTPRKPVALLQPENTEVENLHLGIRATLELQDGLQQNRHSGAALRYLLLMASIDWHFRA
ncbi:MULTISPECIES: tyrosine-type recombinase/integrase [Pseudomonas]|uniref:tyrosine-type recombinase/integrase n=1 Tax=Pseudomonas TaxID=286 RepID=UPI00104CE6A1|nr:MULTISPECIES: tyrosine-type recombinase/integrase [Pseudomonas]MBA1210474.1 tyrosine-type recombinase/integrase [Pseudomonas psychrotolerans]